MERPRGLGPVRPAEEGLTQLRVSPSYVHACVWLARLLRHRGLSCLCCGFIRLALVSKPGWYGWWTDPAAKLATALQVSPVAGSGSPSITVVQPRGLTWGTYASPRSERSRREPIGLTSYREVAHLPIWPRACTMRPAMRWTLPSWDRKALGLILAVLVLSIGFCVFDGDEHEAEHAGLDLCLGMLVTSLTVTLVSRLLLTGLASAGHLAAVIEFSARVPAPPPKTALSS